MASKRQFIEISSAFDSLGHEFNDDYLDSLMDRALKSNLSSAATVVFLDILGVALGQIPRILEKHRKRLEPILTIKDKTFHCEICGKATVGQESVISEKYVYCSKCFGYKGDKAEDALIANDTIKLALDSLENLCGSWVNGYSFETDLVCTVIFETYQRYKSSHKGHWPIDANQERNLFGSLRLMRKAENAYKTYEDEIKMTVSFISQEKIDLRKISNSQIKALFSISQGKRRKRKYSETKTDKVAE